MPGAGPRVSVVITHYNRPVLVKGALDSVLRQTRPADEIVVVDDASVPEARSVVSGFASVAKLHFNDRNLGPSGARNAGLACASGDWVAFLDDDDECLPDRLARQLSYVASHPECQFLGCAVWRVTPNGAREHWGERESGPKSLREVLARTAAMGTTIMARRDTLLRTGGFADGLRRMEDLELGIRLAEAGVVPHFLAEPLVLYRQGHEQATAHWFWMLTSHAAVVARHRRTYTRAFGRLAALQMLARVCRKRGTCRGGIPGRAVWALGQSVFLALGDPLGPLD